MVNNHEIISYLYLFSKKIKQYVLKKYSKNISTLNVFAKKNFEFEIIKMINHALLIKLKIN